MISYPIIELPQNTTVVPPLHQGKCHTEAKSIFNVGQDWYKERIWLVKLLYVLEMIAREIFVIFLWYCYTRNPNNYYCLFIGNLHFFNKLGIWRISTVLTCPKKWLKSLFCIYTCTCIWRCAPLQQTRYDLFHGEIFRGFSGEKRINNDISLMKKAVYVYFNYHKHK